LASIPLPGNALQSGADGGLSLLVRGADFGEDVALGPITVYSILHWTRLAAAASRRGMLIENAARPRRLNVDFVNGMEAGL
jgi:hypothetical protein